MLTFSDRIVPIPGNLAQLLLGLPPDTFKVLATEIDAIEHNGADVILVKPYAALKSVNVLGTQESLRLAVTNGLEKKRVKPVHYISTVSIFPSTYSAPKFMEVADLSKVSDQLDNSQQEVGNGGFYGMEVQSAPRCHHRDCSIGVKKLAAGIDSFEIYLQSDKVFYSTLSLELLKNADISYPSVNKELLVTYTAQW
ncbi:hypothetical protein PsorP6_001117 [Peronosclerospora sorghi]|uniref:Uncharacterized protein n=1 Tax=Peronosclerospora sorghi TaxID=230839 RepID=A0ACC0WVX8_9STRA|nr:hypothetical protein PsorP6_001117 [Peronosclerospora sorghi]